MTRTMSEHVVDWNGCFRGTEEDPRECGWCETCGSEVYDNDGHGHRVDAARPTEQRRPCLGESAGRGSREITETIEQLNAAVTERQKGE